MDFKDATTSGMIPDLLTILELGVAIIVSSSVILRPVFDHIFYSISSMTGSQKSYGRSRSRDQSFSDAIRLGPSSPLNKPYKVKVWTDEMSSADTEERGRFPNGSTQAMDDHSSEERILGPDKTGYPTSHSESTHSVNH
jgi:hypothetical protein